MKRILLVAAMLLVSVDAFGQSAGYLNLKQPFFNAAGTAPLNAGRVCTTVTGTTTPLASYTDSAAGTANANPVVLDSTGRADIWLSNALYRIALYANGTGNTCNGTAVGTQIWSADNVTGGQLGLQGWLVSGTNIYPATTTNAVLIGAASLPTNFTTAGGELDVVTSNGINLFPSNGANINGLNIAATTSFIDFTENAYGSAGRKAYRFRNGGITVATLAGTSASMPTATTGQATLTLGNQNGNAVGLLALTQATTGTTTVLLSGQVPTISSAFGASPSVAAGAAGAFTVNVGTGGAATGGVIAMPTATTGWICQVENRTAVAANRGDQRTVQTATTTTTVTVQNQTISTGAALAWTASDVLALSCLGY